MDTVQKVPEELCISCGMCQGVCPLSCIDMLRNKQGQYIPQINRDICVNCGKCFSICPGKGINLQEIYKTIYEKEMVDVFHGNYHAVINCAAKDKEVLKKATSGGVVTTLVEKLLQDEKYQIAFLVDTYNYEQQISVKAYQKGDVFTNTFKSRYIPVSQAAMVRFCIENPNEKVIIVGTGCIVESFCKLLIENKLNRKNYFIIGLFCNSVLNYNSWEYFSRMLKEPLKELRYREKSDRRHYFYGTICLEGNKGRRKLINPGKKMLVKPYLTMEKCIYCFDRLNVLADISVGDNNTKSGDGSSCSVIIRTEIGKQIMKHYEALFDCLDTELERVSKSQQIKLVEQQYRFAKIYSLNKKMDILCGMNDCGNEKVSTSDLNELDKRLRRHKFGSDIKNLTKLFYWMQIKWILVEVINYRGKLTKWFKNKIR